MRRILHRCVASHETLTPQTSSDCSARLDSESYSASKIDAHILALRMHLSMHREERQPGGLLYPPWWHYTRFGLLFKRPGNAPEEARSAAASAAYLAANPDVADVGCEAWWHYINFGRHEGRAWGGPNGADAPHTSRPDIEQGGGTE